MRLQCKVQQVTLPVFIYLNWGEIYHFSIYLVINTNGVTCCTLLYSLIHVNWYMWYHINIKIKCHVGWVDLCHQDLEIDPSTPREAEATGR